VWLFAMQLFLLHASILPSSLLSKSAQISIYKNIILPVALCGFENWSLTLKEEHRLKLFGNRALKRIFGPKRGEVIGGWRKLLNEEFNLRASPSTE
jgi:hypothetical protein